jgi:Protein of unknown function (DUF1580)
VKTNIAIAASLLTETLLSFSQASRRLPSLRRNRPVAPATIWRWVSQGVRLPDGSRLKLEAVRVGGHWITSLEALTRFVQQQTDAQYKQVPSDQEAKPLSIRTPSQRQRAAQQADDELESIGM